jgi:hypothetical protein
MFIGSNVEPMTLKKEPVETLQECRAEQLTFMYQFSKEYPEMNATWTMNCERIAGDDG